MQYYEEYKEKITMVKNTAKREKKKTRTALKTILAKEENVMKSWR